MAMWPDQDDFFYVVVIAGSGPGSGLFVYSPSPGFGNLVASITATGGSLTALDPYLNSYIKGIASYFSTGPTQFFASTLNEGELNFWTAPGAGGPWQTTGTVMTAGATPLALGGPNAREFWLAPSGDGTGVKDTAAIYGALLAANTVHLIPSNAWHILDDSLAANPIVLGPEQYLKGGGRGNTTVNCVGGGTGTYIRQFNPTYGGGGKFGGGVSGLTLDGTLAGAGAVGYQLGDGEQYEVDLIVQHFNGAGSLGVWLNNTIWWTEKLHGTIFDYDNTTGVQFDINPFSGAHAPAGSFGYLDLTVYTIKSNTGGQSCVNVTNGANVYNGRLVIKGNMTGSASVLNTYTLSVNGVAPAGSAAPGNLSRIFGCELDIQAEVPSGSAHPPYTIFLSTSNTILACRGILDFTQGTGTFRACNVFVPGSADRFGYSGIILGDFNLYLGNTFSPNATTVAMGYAQAFFNGATGDIYVDAGDFFSATLSANVNINFIPAGVSQTIPAPQRKTIIIHQAAAGGPFTVTWPNPGAPTVTNPAVRWANGATPVMSPAANAVDVYLLETFDGVIWYGTAYQSENAAGWIAMGAPIAGWSVTVAEYRPVGDGLVAVQIEALLPPGAPPVDGTVIFTAANGLAAGYQPAIPRRLICYGASAIGTETPALEFETDGSVQVYGVGGTTIARMDGNFLLSVV